MSPESPSVAAPTASARAKHEHRAEAASYERQQSKIVFAIVFLLSAVLMAYWMNRGWIPGDDGTLAQGALRVMHGQLPHRDFVENYTGGLDYYHALAFRLLGVNLTALRMAVFVVFLGWVPALFAIARRFAGPLAAGLITLLCVSWSLPTYPAAMPSWYNLFLATFGTLALLRFTESGKRRCLFVAGLAGGLSFLVKVTALYYIAAVLLFLIYREQRRSEGGNGGDAGYRTFAIAGLSVFAVAVCLLVRGNVTLFTVTEIALPPVAIAIALVLGSVRSAAEPGAKRFRRLFGEAWPFAAGAILPVAIFLIPYVVSSSVGAFFSGVFVAGAGRATSLIRPQQASAHLDLFVYAALLAITLGVAMYARRFERVFAAVLGVSGVVVLVLAGTHAAVSMAVFYAVALVLPAVVVGSLVLMSRPGDGLDEIVFLLLALAATGSLIRFPFSAPVYFAYCAPLVALATCAVALRGSSGRWKLSLTVLLGFFVLFGALRVVPSFIYLGNFTPGLSVYPLLSERGANVQGMDALSYDEVTHVVQEKAKRGPILAFPECPEVFFLSGLENAGRNDNGVSAAEVEKAMREQSVKVVVINQKPFFAASKPGPEVEGTVGAEFPHRALIGKYLIYWRD